MFRGQRFHVDLDGEDGEGERQGQRAPVPGAFVGDVLERKPAATAPPKAPTVKNRTGFPEHRRRNVDSRFKQQGSTREAHVASQSDDVKLLPDEKRDGTSTGEQVDSGKTKTWEEEEKERIDKENRQKLAQMSPEEIEEERRELMNSFGHDLIQRLLQRSNIDSGSTEADLSDPAPIQQTSTRAKSSNVKSVSFAEPTADEGDDAATPKDTSDTVAAKDSEDTPDPLPHDTVHFPQPLQPPDLDPSSATFLQDLHSKYFPSLPSDPDKLEWMQSSSAKTSKNTYDPSASALDPKDLRFSFKGELIAPKTAAEIPVTAGLHHHGDAPDAAGYTISELVHLGHSSFAPQRCIAFQTLGRLLYRLGKGEFGDSGEPVGEGSEGTGQTFGALARGIWREVEREKVVEMLVMESEGKGVDGGKHVSAKAYATEAVWLWQRGGGRSWKAE